MRRPNQLRLAALLGSLAAIAFALVAALLIDLALGGRGALGLRGTNPSGVLAAAVFVVVYATGLRYVRSLIRLPSPTLLSFGLVAPPAARDVAARVPVISAAGGLQTIAENRVVIVEEDGVPIGVAGFRRERMVSWDELVTVDGSVAVTDLRSVLAHEALLVVLDGDEPIGVVTQEMYLAGLWGTVR